MRRILVLTVVTAVALCVPAGLANAQHGHGGHGGGHSIGHGGGGHYSSFGHGGHYSSFGHGGHHSLHGYSYPYSSGYYYPYSSAYYYPSYSSSYYSYPSYQPYYYPSSQYYTYPSTQTYSSTYRPCSSTSAIYIIPSQPSYIPQVPYQPRRVDPAPEAVPMPPAKTDPGGGATPDPTLRLVALLNADAGNHQHAQPAPATKSAATQRFDATSQLGPQLAAPKVRPLSSDEEIPWEVK